MNRRSSDSLPQDSGGPAVGAWVVVFVVSLAVYAMGGNLGRLYHDDAIFFYGGQEMVRGTPVYEGIFDHKGPLGQMVCALGVAVADLVGRDDLIVTRYLFLAIAAATATGVFALAAQLFRSRVVALLCWAVFLNNWSFGLFAFSGTRPKLLMVLFEVGALLAMARGRWFVAGMATALGAFAWQPMGLFIVIVGLLAWARSSPGGERRRALSGVVLGGALPTLAMSVYFLAVGAFDAFLDGCFLFNLRFLENQGDLAYQTRSMLQILVYNGMGVLTLLGLLAMPVLFGWRWREVGRRGFLRDRWAGVLLCFPLPVLWSLQDFQQGPDFFVFLPFVALSLGWLLAAMGDGIADQLGLTGERKQRCVALPAIVLVLFAGVVLRFASTRTLSTQWAEAAEFEQEFGDARLAVIGHPDALVLLDRTNVTRYGFIMRGIAAYIDAHEPGGFEGWLESVSNARPEVLIVDERYAENLGEYGEAFGRWLARYDRRPERIGPWTIFLPRDA